MITDQDVTKLKKTFATKEDLKVFVTKTELKKEIEKLATKKDLNIQTERIDALVYEVGDLKVEVAELGEKIESFVDRLETKMDAFLGNVDRLELESNLCTTVQRRHTQQIEGLAQHAGFILPA